MAKFNKIEDAIEAIKCGEIVIVLDDEERENEGDLVMAADKVTSYAVNFMMKEGRGLICAPVSREIAGKLKFPLMVDEVGGDSKKCNFTISVDYEKGTSTGISASDRAKTIRAIVAKGSKGSDFDRPGHVFPIQALDGGVLVRAGHTEAAVDLAHMAGLSPAGVICEIAKENGEMMRRDDLLKFAKKHSLNIVTIKDLIAFRHKKEKLVDKVAETILPTEFGDFDMKVYKDHGSGSEHIVLVKGKIGKKETLVRVQSECLTGEIFHSKKCDCRGQLDKALEKIAEKGGVLVYMRQEGRGIGLVNKIKAYELQRNGLDTVEANEKLGFAADLRNYGIGAQILADLGVREINLMTNNPTKVVGLGGFGIKIINRLPLEIKPSKQNYKYLKTKKDKMGHLLNEV